MNSKDPKKHQRWESKGVMFAFENNSYHLQRGDTVNDTSTRPSSSIQKISRNNETNTRTSLSERYPIQQSDHKIETASCNTRTSNSERYHIQQISRGNETASCNTRTSNSERYHIQQISRGNETASCNTRTSNSERYHIQQISRGNETASCNTRTSHSGLYPIQQISYNNKENANYGGSSDDSGIVEDSEKFAYSTVSSSAVQCTSESGVNKKVRPRKNKNQTVRKSRISPVINESSRRISFQEHSDELQCQRVQSSGDEEQRLPISSGSHREHENMNILHQGHGGYTDFVIHNSEKDSEAAKVFCQQLLNLNIPDLTVDIFEFINPGMSEMKSVSLLHERYKTVLLFVTHNYSRDKLRCHQAEMLQRKGLETEALTQWVVPVWVDSDAKLSMPELAPIKGIKYHNLNQNKKDFLQQVTAVVIAGRQR